MAIKFISLLKSIFLLPTIGLVCIVGFFFVFLTPPQRAVMIKEIFASLPGTKNFVNIHYKNQLNLKKLQTTEDLKTFFMSVDYLASIQDAQGDKYIAIYPFIIEAGYNLKESKVVVDKKDEMKILNINLPPPEIMNVDESKNALVIRDKLSGKYEYVIQPVKTALERLAKDDAISQEIFAKANQRAIEYYKDFWRGSYDEIKINIEAANNEPFIEDQLPHLSIKFAVSRDNFNYQYTPTKEFAPYDGLFKDNNESEIRTGYSQKYTKNYDALWEGVRETYNSEDSVFLKFRNPEYPLERGVACSYNKTYVLCFIQSNGELFYIYHMGNDEEQIKMTLPNAIYLAWV